MNVSLKQLRTLIAIADHGGVAAAARASNISQPAVTRTLRDLESALETRLFVRSPSGMSPTPYGEVLVRRARRAFAELSAAEHEFGALKGNARGRIVIGTLPFMRSSVVPVAVSRFLEDHPDMKVSIVDDSYEMMLRGVCDGEIDLMVGTLRETPLPPELRSEVLFEDPLCVVARSGHPLCGRKTVTLADLATADWVLPGPTLRQRRQLERIFADAGYAPPRTSVEAVSLSTVRMLLMGSDRLTVASRQRIQYEESAGDLAVLPVELPGTSRPIGIVLRREALPSPVQRTLIRHMTEVAAEYFDA